MFDKSQGTAVTGPPQVQTDITTWTELQLLHLREQINALLPPKALKDIDLEQELALQFQIARALQASMMGPNEEPQKVATVLNACASTLQNLVKMQADYYTADRLKNIEMRLIRALDNVPKKYLTEFFEWYGSDKN